MIAGTFWLYYICGVVMGLALWGFAEREKRIDILNIIFEKEIRRIISPRTSEKNTDIHGGRTF